MYYLGIDWADDHHDICLMASDGRVLAEFQIGQSLKGFHLLQQYLDRHQPVRINIERTDGLLVDWLVENNYDVFFIPPTVMARRRPRRSKDDRGDAFQLAHLLRLNDPECRPIVRHTALVRHLQQLLSALDRVLQLQRRQANWLIYLLKQYYPAALKAFAAPHSLIALRFLKRYPTPEAAREASIHELMTFLLEYHYPQPARKLPDLYSLLQEPSPTASQRDGWMTDVAFQVQQLEALFHQRAQLERDVLKAFKQHVEASWWQQWPGVGPLTAARLLAWIGDNRDRFPSPEVLQAIAGTAPVTRRSGRTHHVEFRHACCHPLRKAMDDMARLSVKKSGWAQAYYVDQRRRGHKSARAYRALANRWLSIIWKLWVSQEWYDESRHVANRDKNGAKQLREYMS